MTASQYTSRPPIYIEGNSNFTAQNGVTGGTGAPGDPYLITGWSINATGAYGIEVRNTSASFVIGDLHVANPNSGPPYPSPVFFWNVTHARIENVSLSGNVSDVSLTSVVDVSLQGIDSSASPYAGVWLNQGHNVSLTQSTLTGSVVAAAENVTVSSNRFPLRGTVKVASSRFIRVEDNWAPNSLIRLNFTRDAVVKGNYASAIWLWPSQIWNTTVDSNVVVGGGSMAIHPLDAHNLVVTNNTVTGGMNFAGVSNVTVVGNRVSDSPVGICFAGSQDILVYGNDFVKNSVQAQSENNTRLRWNASYPVGGNYWSDYTGTDQFSGPLQNIPGPDGFGDAPYTIDANDTDSYPAMAFIGNDTTPPSVSISSPVEGATFTSSPVAVTGSAFDTGGSGLQAVRARDNNGSWMTATGTTSWSASVALTSGPNRIEAQAWDGAGNLSPLASVNVTYNPPPPPANTPPYANFSWSPPSGNVSTVFTFTSTSWDYQDPPASLQVRWDWESDGTWDTGWSTNATATHTFTVAATYNVTMEVMDTGGLTSNATRQVVVTEIPPPPPPPLTASIVAHPTSGTMPLTVTFNSTVSGGVAPYQYDWHFGDGSTSPAANTVHIYVTGGPFPVWLNVYDAHGGSALSNYLYVNVTPAAVNLTVSLPTEFTSSASGITVTLTASATGGSPPYTFSWDFGDGSQGTGASVTHTYAAAGTYTISVTVRDSGGQTVTRTYTLPVVGLSGPGPELVTPAVIAAFGVVSALAFVFAVLWLRQRRRAPPPGPPT